MKKYIQFNSPKQKKSEAYEDKPIIEIVNLNNDSDKDHKYDHINVHKFEFKYWYVILLTLNASLGNFFIGWDVGVFDPIQINLKIMFGWNEQETKVYSSFISASLHFGAILGALISGYISKKYGRKHTFMMNNVLSWIGTGLTLILNEYCIIFGRIISGISVGLYSTAISVYVNEFAPYQITGLCGTIYELVYSSGIFLCYLAGLNLPGEDEHQNEWWRIMVLIPGLLTGINMLMLLFVFKWETPKYLQVIKNDEEASKECLRTIYKREEDVEEMIRDYKKLARTEESQVNQNLCSKKYRIRLFIACVLMIGQQVGGADVVFMFSDHIYMKIVEDKKTATTYTIFTGLSVVMAGIISVFIIERFGRRRLFLFGHILIVLSLAVISLLYYFEIISTVIIYVFMFFSFINGISIGPVSYIYSSDVLPEGGVGIAVLLNYMSAFLCTQTFLFLEASFLQAQGTFGLYGLASLAVLILGFMYLKETKNKSAIQIDKLFNN
jgi:MFS transporter, SP family, galactose:H+ symporter